MKLYNKTTRLSSTFVHKKEWKFCNLSVTIINQHTKQQKRAADTGSTALLWENVISSLNQNDLSSLDTDSSSAAATAATAWIVTGVVQQIAAEENKDDKKNDYPCAAVIVKKTVTAHYVTSLHLSSSYYEKLSVGLLSWIIVTGKTNTFKGQNLCFGGISLEKQSFGGRKQYFDETEFMEDMWAEEFFEKPTLHTVPHTNRLSQVKDRPSDTNWWARKRLSSRTDPWTWKVVFCLRILFT